MSPPSLSWLEAEENTKIPLAGNVPDKEIESLVTALSIVQLDRSISLLVVFNNSYQSDPVEGSVENSLIKTSPGLYPTARASGAETKNALTLRTASAMIIDTEEKRLMMDI